MTDKTDATATDAAAFFAPLLSDWQPAADQSSYADYTASDLMTATGTAVNADGKISLSFAMTHRMALAVIEMPKTHYTFVDNVFPDYEAETPVQFISEAKPLSMDGGTHRYLVNPSQSAPTITGSYDDGPKEFNIKPSVAQGSYKTYKVDGGETIKKIHNLQIGDYILADGSLVGKDNLTEDRKASAIAVVFHVGQHVNDGSDYSATGIGRKQCHGYAVALKDATSNYCKWGVYGTELGCCPTDAAGNKQNNYNNPDIDWCGYAWTQKIITVAGGKGNLNASDQAGYPATYYAVVAYETGCKAPTNSSGWFLPSIGQMWNIYQNRSSLFNGKAVVTSLKPDWYWSSSESYGSPANRALYVNVDLGDVSDGIKGGMISYVRPVLAF